MLKFRDLWALEKRGNFVFCTIWKLWTFISDWIRTRDLACRSRTPFTIPSFLMIIFSKFFRQILKDFYNLSVAESPVGSSSNRRFRLKRQKTRNVNNFWPRWNFCMKFSNLYEEVQKLSDFVRISHEAVVHPVNYTTMLAIVLNR